MHGGMIMFVIGMALIVLNLLIALVTLIKFPFRHWWLDWIVIFATFFSACSVVYTMWGF